MNVNMAYKQTSFLHMYMCIQEQIKSIPLRIGEVAESMTQDKSKMRPVLPRNCV